MEIIWGMYWITYLKENLSSRKNSKTVDVGIVLEKSLVDNYRGLVRCVEVVPNGIDENFITSEDIKTYMKNDGFSIIYLSNLMKEKGYMELIQAVIELVKRRI